MSEADEKKLPKQLGIEYYDEYMHITRKWFGFSVMIASGFMVFWLGIQIFTFVFFSSEFAEFGDVLLYLMIVFVIIDMGLFYLLAAGWVNKTDIFVNEKIMEIKHGPIRWMGNKVIDATQIRQFFVHKNVTRTDNATHINYEVNYIMADDKPIKLIGGIEERDQAEFIERKIEDYLGIEDVPMPTRWD